MNVAVLQALAAITSAVVAVLLYIVARRQTQAGRLNAVRDIIRYHHAREMRELRKLVRNDLVRWMNEGKPLDETNQDWSRLKSAYEDILNYYEYLGSLLKDHLVDDDIVLRLAHNSAVEIWKIHERYGDRIRPQDTRAKDFAGDFAYLVTRAKEYRRAHGLDVDAT